MLNAELVNGEVELFVVLFILTDCLRWELKPALKLETLGEDETLAVPLEIDPDLLKNLLKSAIDECLVAVAEELLSWLEWEFGEWSSLICCICCGVEKFSEFPVCVLGDDEITSWLVEVDLLDFEKKLANEEEDLLELLWYDEDTRASSDCLETMNLESIWEVDVTVGEDNWWPVINWPLLGIFENEELILDPLPEDVGLWLPGGAYGIDADNWV